MTHTQIQDEVIAKYRIELCYRGELCKREKGERACWGRVHAHVKKRRVCKWKRANGIVSTFTLFHEIGHVETTTGTMRRCESEYHATTWALQECAKYGLTVPPRVIDDYQEYIDMELDRGVRRGGRGYAPQALKLKRV